MSTELAVSRNVSLWKIEEALLELVSIRDEAQTDEEKAVADDAIRAYVRAEIVKADGLLAYLRKCGAHAAMAQAEAQRISAIGRWWARQEERLRDFVLSAMLAANKKKIEGNLGSFSVQANPPSVEVTDPSLVPYECKILTIEVNAATWNAFQKKLQEFTETGRIALSNMMTAASFKGSMEPSKALIAAEMRKPCERCEGSGKEIYYSTRMDESGNVDEISCEDKCSVCDGTGKKHVPGARLITDKTRLVVR